MAGTIQGPGGLFTIDGGFFSGKIQGWSATESIGKVDTTGFADNGNVVVEGVDIQITGGSAAGTGYTGSGSTFLPTTGIGATPTLSAYNANITLQAYTGNTISFPALITGVSMNRQARGKFDVTFNFESRGAISTSWT